MIPAFFTRFFFHNYLFFFEKKLVIKSIIDLSHPKNEGFDTVAFLVEMPERLTLLAGLSVALFAALFAADIDEMYFNASDLLRKHLPPNPIALQAM